MMLYGAENAPTSFKYKDQTYYFQLRKKKLKLPASIKLDNVIQETYKGTDVAKHFESKITLTTETGESRKARIYMNHPLKYGGYTFFQASFQRQSAGETSVLSVSRDPGQAVSFAGYCIVVLGLVLIFFFKPLLRRLDDRSARSRPAGDRP